jgi:L-lactate dehydrogenase complex protein LldG
MDSPNNSKSRERILQRLRAHPAPFDRAKPRPASYLPVSRIDDGEDLAARFDAELTRIAGKFHLKADESEAADTVIELVLAETGPYRTVISWENLPIPDLHTRLKERGLSVHVPCARRDERAAELRRIEPVRVGITGADAALAATGTLVLETNEQQGRIPSLLPPVHIAILPRDRILARVEDWVAVRARAALAESSSVVFVTGPSRTGDIEMTTILGMHGPGVLHVVAY